VKNLSLVINVVLLLAVAILYYLHFSSQKSGVKESSEAESSQIEYSMAYVNTDSILANYDYFEELQEKLKSKSEKLQADYQNRATSLQNEVNDYQRNVSRLTIGQAKALEENLIKKEQNLRLYQESLTQELLKERSKTDQELYEQISNFLDNYGKENNLQLVVQYNQGSDVLYATNGMDITKTVTDGLNELYNNKGVTSDSTSAEIDSLSSK